MPPFVCSTNFIQYMAEWGLQPPRLPCLRGMWLLGHVQRLGFSSVPRSSGKTFGMTMLPHLPHDTWPLFGNHSVDRGTLADLGQFFLLNNKRSPSVGTLLSTFVSLFCSSPLYPVVLMSSAQPSALQSPSPSWCTLAGSSRLTRVKWPCRSLRRVLCLSQYSPQIPALRLSPRPMTTVWPARPAPAPAARPALTFAGEEWQLGMRTLIMHRDHYIWDPLRLSLIQLNPPSRIRSLTKN